MGPVGSKKGNGHGGVNRGRAYGMMLVLAFSAAVFGVLVIHKLRERRLFNLLIKEKETDLFSLQILFQKQRESSKVVKKKLEEMKAKAATLRTQKMELTNKLIQMQSMIASLREEQRALESALEEKQNKINTLTDKEIELKEVNLRISTLMESLKQREAAIEEMKRRLENRTDPWSVSRDDPPSSTPVNITAVEDASNKDRKAVGESKEDEVFGDGQSEISNGEALTGGEVGNRSTYKGRDHGEIPKNGELEKVKNGRDVGDKNKEEGQAKGEVQGEEQSEKLQDSQRGKILRIRTNDEWMEIVDSSRAGDGSNSDDESSNKDAVESKGHVTGDGQPEKLENSQEGEGNEQGTVSENGKKLEMPEHSRTGVVSRITHEHSYKSKMKGKTRKKKFTDRALETIEKSRSSTASEIDIKDAPGEEMSVSSRGGESAMIDAPDGAGLGAGAESGYRNAVEGIGQGAISKNSQLERPANPTGSEDLRKRAENGDETTSESNEQGSVLNNDRLNMPRNSQDGEGLKNSNRKDEKHTLLEGKKKAKRYKNGKLKIPEQSKDGEGLRMRNPTEGRQETGISRDGQLLKPHNSIDGSLKIKAESADAGALEGKERETVSDDDHLEKLENSEDDEGSRTRKTDEVTRHLQIKADGIERLGDRTSDVTDKVIPDGINGGQAEKADRILREPEKAATITVDKQVENTEAAANVFRELENPVSNGAIEVNDNSTTFESTDEMKEPELKEDTNEQYGDDDAEI